MNTTESESRFAGHWWMMKYDEIMKWWTLCLDVSRWTLGENLRSTSICLTLPLSTAIFAECPVSLSTKHTQHTQHTKRTSTWKALLGFGSRGAGCALNCWAMLRPSFREAGLLRVQFCVPWLMTLHDWLLGSWCSSHPRHVDLARDWWI